jgi:hypothetical protein
MKAVEHKKIKSILELYESVTEEERIIVDVLRQFVIEMLPAYCKEKISFNVPYFYGKKGICIIWPASIPRGGIKKGVLFGFWYGHKLKDKDRYLTHGTNRQIFYKIYTDIAQINFSALKKLLKEAITLDQNWLSHCIKKAVLSFKPRTASQNSFNMIFKNTYLVY